MLVWHECCATRRFFPAVSRPTFYLSCFLYVTCVHFMKALFIELPAFARYRAEYLDDDGFRVLQTTMMKYPCAGDVIEGTGGLRKLRYGDPRRGKGKRGGLRVIYYWWDGGSQFWLFTLYDKDEMQDLNAREKKALKDMLEAEREARR